MRKYSYCNKAYKTLDILFIPSKTLSCSFLLFATMSQQPFSHSMELRFTDKLLSNTPKSDKHKSMKHPYFLHHSQLAPLAGYTEILNSLEKLNKKINKTVIACSWKTHSQYFTSLSEMTPEHKQNTENPTFFSNLTFRYL